MQSGVSARSEVAADAIDPLGELLTGSTGADDNASHATERVLGAVAFVALILAMTVLGVMLVLTLAWFVETPAFWFAAMDVLINNVFG